MVAAGLDLHPRQRRSRRRLQGEGDAFESALADVFRREHRQVGMLEKEVRGVNDGKHRAAAEVGPFAPAGRRAPPDHRERARIDGEGEPHSSSAAAASRSDWRSDTENE